MAEGFSFTERNLMTLDLQTFEKDYYIDSLDIKYQNYHKESELSKFYPEIIDLVMISEKGTLDDKIYPEMQLKENAEELLGLKKEKIGQISNDSTKLLFNGNHLIGLVLVSVSKNKQAYIVQVAVHPDFRNKKLATYLMIKSIKSLQELGIQKVSLHVTTTIPAKNLYKKLGFKDVQTLYYYWFYK